MLSFFLDSTGTTNVYTTEEYFPKKNGDDFAVYTMGVTDHIDKLLSGSPPDGLNLTPPRLAEYLVTLEAMAHPLDVNFPIDIVELTDTGADWIQREAGSPIEFK